MGFIEEVIKVNIVKNIIGEKKKDAIDKVGEQVSFDDDIEKKMWGEQE